MADLSRWVWLEATTVWNDKLYVCTKCGTVEKEPLEVCKAKGNARPEARPGGVLPEFQRLSCGAGIWVFPGLTRAGYLEAERAKRRTA